MKFPQSLIDELKARLRLSQVIGRVITVKKAGREYQALCPFHNEKTPSFTINDEKGFYHCFGCGAHGDVIGFTMEYEHLSYPDAVKKLAGEAGLALPAPDPVLMAQEEKKDQSLRNIQLVADWLHKSLYESREGEVARSYLHSRGVNEAMIRRFGLGYAPLDRDILSRVMADKGIAPAALIDMGMLIAVEGKAPYARFRRRLMFPIRDAKGRVIAFGGRVLPGEANDEAAKYINSPETPWFHKGRQLYHLDGARKEALKLGQLVIAEGYMDVVAMVQAGLQHVVAPLGTAITQEQLALCWSMADEPVLCLDGDNAGLRAMNRAVELALPLLKPGKSLRIARLPAGEDPDSLLKTRGRSALDEVLASASSMADVLWQQAFSATTTTPEGRAREERELMARLERISDSDVKRYYRDEMRSRLRARQQQAGSGTSAGKFNAVKMPAQPLPKLLSKPEDQVAQAVTKLCALVAWHPSILADGERETLWLNLPLPKPWQVQLHHALLREAHVSELQPSAAPIPLSNEAVRALAQASEALKLPPGADYTQRELTALQLWPQLINDVQRSQLLADIAQAENALAQEVSEAHFERLAALKAQFEQLDRERNLFYQQDPLGGVAS